MGDNELFDWVEDGNAQMFTLLGAKKRARTPKKMDYVGWGSRQLIEFLESIGVDAEKQISQYDAASIVTNYVSEKNLLHPEKKKRVVCDDLLFSLFGKKTISRIKIYDLLEPHYAENQVDSDDFFFGLDEEDHDSVQQKNLGSVRKPASKKTNVKGPQSCFAAIIPDNIRLVYLKRSLIEKLVKDPETFQGKIVGSFVRIKSDPNDYLQKNPYMLVLVTGLEKVSQSDDKNAGILLQVSNFVKDVQISMLSDDNFLEEECEDLRQRVKDGLLKRPTILELQEKIQALHEDVTNHWIVGELALLQKLINRANEKGWRRELHEYLERKKLLDTEEEKARLLREIPEVVPEDIEVEATPQGITEEDNDSPTSTLGEATENRIFDLTPKGTSTAWISFSTDSIGSQAAKKISKSRNMADNHDGDLDQQKQPASFELNDHQEKDQPEDYLNNDLDEPKNQEAGDQADDPPEEQEQPTPTDVLLERNVEAEPAAAEKKNNSDHAMNVEVIDLSDDDEDDDDVNIIGGTHTLDFNPGASIWYYADPQGDIQGPFPLTSLKHWMDLDYFALDFKVWRRGQSQNDAVLLTDIINKIYSG